MKKLFTFLTISLLTVFSVVTKAQLICYTTSPSVNGDTSTTLGASVTVYNSSADTVVVKVQRTSNNLAAGHDTYFCWGITCYPPITSISQAFKMAPGDSSLLICDAEPKGTFGTDLVTLLVYDVANASNDKVTIDYTFNFTPTGISGLNRPSADFLNCTQSNMGDLTNVNYSLSNYGNGKLILRNLLGSVVKEIILNDRKGTVAVSTSDLPAGIYMFFLYNNNEPVATRKAIITHR